MEAMLEQVLTQRRRRLRLWFRGASLGGALGLHLVLLIALLAGPRLLAARREPIEYVAVRVVPAAALPKPARRAPAQPRVAQPPPPKEVPPERDVPVLSDPRKKVAEAKKEEVPPPQPTLPPAEETGGEGQAARDLGFSPVGATAGVGFDNPDFTYGYYVDRMLGAIRAHWRRPPLGGEVEMVLHFRIHRDGRVSDVRIVKSSGYDSFDLAGRRAVQSASPLPPLPRSYRHGTLGVNLRIRE